MACGSARSRPAGHPSQSGHACSCGLGSPWTAGSHPPVAAAFLLAHKRMLIAWGHPMQARAGRLSPAAAEGGTYFVRGSRIGAPLGHGRPKHLAHGRLALWGQGWLVNVLLRGIGAPRIVAPLFLGRGRARHLAHGRLALWGHGWLVVVVVAEGGTGVHVECPCGRVQRPGRLSHRGAGWQSNSERMRNGGRGRAFGLPPAARNGWPGAQIAAHHAPPRVISQHPLHSHAQLSQWSLPRARASES
jgi:hypothetical protein